VLNFSAASDKLLYFNISDYLKHGCSVNTEIAMCYRLLNLFLEVSRGYVSPVKTRKTLRVGEDQTLALRPERSRI